MKVEECSVGMKVIINQESDGFWTMKYRGSLATIECILSDNYINIYCEDKSIKDGDGLIRCVNPDCIDRVVSHDSIECDVNEILI